MAYQLDRYNGTFFTSVDDQTINSTATDLRFVGRNYSGYGEIENENFLHLLENFANSSAPPRAISGQLWFDTVTKKVKVFDGTKFKPVGGAESSATAPAGYEVGDFWYDNQNEQIFVWNGGEFILVGPEKSPVYGETSVSPAVVKDTVGSDQQILKMQVGAEVIAIISRATFTINPVINPILGFSELKPGINFINSASGQTTSNHRFWGTVSNADKLNGFTANDFLRSGNPVFTSRVSFRDNGFDVGDQSDLRVQIVDGNNPIIESRLDKPLIFRISNNDIDVRDIALIKGTGIEPGQTELYNLGAVGTRWNEIFAKTVRATTFYGKFIGEIETINPETPLNLNTVNISGSLNVEGANKNLNVNLTGNGTITLNSGTTGTINNINIGTVTPGTASVTTLQASSTVRFTNITEATSSATGTLVVAGGTGIGGALYVSGNAFFTGQGAIRVPVGTTGTRPAAPQQGMIRFNTTIGEWEGFDGTEWRLLGGDADEDYGLITGQDDSFVDYGSIF